MTLTEKITKGTEIIKKKILDSILDISNYSIFSDTEIECLDYNANDHDVDLTYEVKIKLRDTRIIEFKVRVNIVTETMKIHMYEGYYEDFSPFNSTMEHFWRRLFFEALSI